jgi:Ala-tRNA(Pro) deacylase
MGVNYRVSKHQDAFTAQDLAAAEHVPGREVLKPVIVRADGRYLMCALPAPYKVDLNELGRQLQCEHVELVEEGKLTEIFPECELGAEAPIGRLYNMPTVMDESVMGDTQVIFQAGSHSDAIVMTLADYRRAAMPEVAHFGRHM